MDNVSGTVSMRVIVFKDDGQWVAQCLEHDIGAQGPDVDTLMTRLEVVLDAECKASLDKGEEPFKGIDPAPARFQQMWERRARSVDMSPAPWMVGAPGKSMSLGLGLVA
jgi:hypothetical protein